MKKVWEHGIEPWDYEIDVLKVEHGLPEWEARAQVVTKWMKAGKFEPLFATIKKEGMLRGPILRLLAEMLADGRLKFAGGRGGP